MFGLLRLALTVLVCVLVVGFFLGWFSFSQTPPDPQTNKMNINVSVDKRKMGTDLQSFEQRVNKGIQDLKNPANSASPPAGQPNGIPGFSLGPVTVQPNGQAYNQPGTQSGAPGLSFGPITFQPSGQGPAPAAPPSGPPQFQIQTPDYQFTAPLNLPPPGER
jgi:hypothetical protein